MCGPQTEKILIQIFPSKPKSHTEFVYSTDNKTQGRRSF